MNEGGIVGVSRFGSVFGVGLFLTFLAGVVLASSFWYFRLESISKRVVPVDDLPIGKEMLQNPAVSAWFGGVKGKVVAKDDHAWVVEDKNGNKITITDLLPGGNKYNTQVFWISKDMKTTKEVTFGDMVVGAEVVGDFWFFKEAKDRAVGNIFTVYE